MKNNDSPKLIAIMGATGNQGGAVIQAFQTICQERGKYKLRAMTRDPSSGKAQTLKESGLVEEIVQADANDEASLVKAFEGCHGAFIVSDNRLEPSYAAEEQRMLRTIKRALIQSAVKHVVLSTSTDTRPYISKAENVDTWKMLESESKMYVPHMDGKSEVSLEFHAELPTTLLLPPFYTDNFINYGMGPSRPNGDANSPYGITFPMGNEKLVMATVQDIGKCVCAIFEEGDTYIGQEVGVTSDSLTGEEIAAVFAKVCGQEVQYNDVPTDVYATFFPGAEDLANMFRFYVEFAPMYIKSRSTPKPLLSRMGSVMSLEEYVTMNKAAFKLDK